MFLIVAKIFWTVAQPLAASLLLIVLGLLLAIRFRKSGVIVAVLGVLVLAVSSFTTTGALLIRPLEERFERPAWPEHVGAIILLGGATNGPISAARQISEFNLAGDRFAETLRLAQLYPEAKIVISGGMAVLMDGGEPEAETAQRFFLGMGIPQDRQVLENQARNTEENAEFSKSLLAGIEGPKLLVTSAFHMPRSMGLFRKAGIEVLSWPTDYRSSGLEGFGVDVTNPVDNLMTTTTAIREWVGLAVYDWTGKIDEIFPGP
ncbi:MAG: YdcF family protein [Devosia sp.]|uniref:YdcF family protein n=1 Tax=Devosia sp. TaxID=1871048 RepID=UPI00261BB6D7|nr:YdcF family protein [Devosia sp.]MDB5527592.1 YdcF family protein [Devosia sp.]